MYTLTHILQHLHQYFKQILLRNFQYYISKDSISHKMLLVCVVSKIIYHNFTHTLNLGYQTLNWLESIFYEGSQINGR